MSKINNAVILVTGGAGFIGSHLVDELLENGHNVLALDNLRNGKLENLEDAFRNDRFKFIKADITDPVKMLEISKGIDVIYHLACLGVRHSLHSPFENHRVNAEGTLNLLAAAKENKVEKFYYISTSEVYGKTSEFPIKETSPTFPVTVYGASKLAGENYTRAYHESFGLNTTILRIFNNYGTRAHYERDSGEVIPRSIVKALYGKNPVIFGGGEITRDFFFVRDTARVLTSLLEKELNGEIINIGTGEEITIKVLVEKVLELMNEPEVQIDYLPARPADTPRLWVDNQKMGNLIKKFPLKTFSEGLLETIEYYKSLARHQNLIAQVEQKNWE